MKEWKCKEFFNGLLGVYPSKDVTKFLNSLSEEQSLEAKVVIVNTFAWIWYRE